MEVRRITLFDYKEIANWWKDQDRAILAWEALPQLGWMITDGDNNLACSWLYLTDSITGFVGWTTVNPSISWRKKNLAVKLLEKALAFNAEKAGCKVLFMFSSGGGFSRLLKKEGWADSLIKHDLLLRGVG